VRGERDGEPDPVPRAAARAAQHEAHADEQRGGDEHGGAQRGEAALVLLEAPLRALACAAVAVCMS
jgi:hypothetical protein